MCIDLFRIFFLFLSASYRPRPVRPWGNNLGRHLRSLFLWERPEDCSAGGNPPQVSHVGFSFILGQYLRHVPILRSTLTLQRLTLRRAEGYMPPRPPKTSRQKRFQGTILRTGPAAFSLWHKHAQQHTLTLAASQPAWETPITVSVGLVL